MTRPPAPQDVVKEGIAGDDVYVMGTMTTETATHQAVACPVCHGDTELWVQDLESAIGGASVDAYRCRVCNSIFSWPLAVPDGLYDAIYRHSSELAGYSRYARYAEHCERARDGLGYLADQEDVYWAVAEVLAKHPESKSWRIVEIGSGLGYLTAALNAAGYDVTGLDISTEAVAKAQTRFGPHYHRQDVFEPDDTFVGAFDFAILLETIEHVPDPKHFLSAVTGLLTPNGSLLVTTPNRDAHPRDAQWRTDLPPVHLFWFTESAVTELADAIGYSAELVDFSEFEREASSDRCVGGSGRNSTGNARTDARAVQRAPVPHPPHGTPTGAPPRRRRLPVPLRRSSIEPRPPDHAFLLHRGGALADAVEHG